MIYIGKDGKMQCTNEGETKGVNMAEKVLRGDLDDRSRDIAGEILEKDRKSIEKLKKLL